MEPMKPVSVPGKQRQRFTTYSGIALERAYISMTPPVWELLTTMSRTQRLSHSEVLEFLVKQASSNGNNKVINDKRSN